VDEFKIKTVHGGILSLCAFFLTIFLFYSELSYFYEVKIVDHLFVGTQRDYKQEFHFNITFPAVSCSLLSANVMDQMGNEQDDVGHHVFKHRLDSQGNLIGVATKHEIGNTFTGEDALIDHHTEKDAEGNKVETPKEENTDCGDCYGAGLPGECCNTCERVVTLYTAKGWNANYIRTTAEQCKRENYGAKIGIEKGEGCIIAGYMEVNKVAGNFHIAFGEAVVRDGRHVHQFIPSEAPGFNITHKINHIFYGNHLPLAQYIPITDTRKCALIRFNPIPPSWQSPRRAECLASAACR